MERVALVGPTLGDVREVMIEGPSGLRAIEHLSDKMPIYNVSRRRLEWPNGAVGLVFSAEDADSLRGPQFDAAWCDEIAA
jgi:phage terminase large subunit-like protein